MLNPDRWGAGTSIPQTSYGPVSPPPQLRRAQANSEENPQVCIARPESALSTELNQLFTRISLMRLMDQLQPLLAPPLMRSLRYAALFHPQVQNLIRVRRNTARIGSGLESVTTRSRAACSNTRCRIERR